MAHTIFPDSNESFKQFVANLNEKLISGSNGQYRRKPTFLSAMVAESLPNKPDNYNINTLKAELKNKELRPNTPDEIFSTFNSNTLYKIAKEGRMLRKKRGLALDSAYLQIAEKYGLPNPKKMALACRVPVPEDEFHRIYLGHMIIAIGVGRGSKYHQDRDLYIASYKVPDTSKHNHRDLCLGCVSYGDMLVATDKMGFGSSSEQLAPSKFYICKYSGNEPRIPLFTLGPDEINKLSQHLCIRLLREGYDSFVDKHPFSRITESELFLHLQEWALRHPIIAKNSTSPYFRNWGNLALNQPMNP